MHKLLRLLFAPDGQPGSGGAAGGVQGGGGGSTQLPGDGGAGGSSPAPIRLSDDALVDFGDGKPTKFGDWKSGYMPKSQYDKGVEFLTNIAKTLDHQRQQKPNQPQPQQPQGIQQDPFAEVWESPIVDGAMLKKLYQSGLGPIAKAIQQQQQKLAQMEAQFKQVGQHVGSLTERSSSADYDGMLTGAINNLGLPGFDPKNEAVAPHMGMLKEFARDVFDSHDPNDPNYAKEMPGIFKSRVESMIKFVRALDKARVEAAKTSRPNFMRPGGNIQPGQNQKFKFERGPELARRMFASQESPT
jgi:hypothetical protein